jgi:hypothetical protein
VCSKDGLEKGGGRTCDSLVRGNQGRVGMDVVYGSFRHIYFADKCFL